MDRRSDYAMIAMTKRHKAAIDRQVQEVVSRRCSGLAIDIMKISEVFRAAYIAASGVTGEDVESAVVRTYNQLAREI